MAYHLRYENQKEEVLHYTKCEVEEHTFAPRATANRFKTGTLLWLPLLTSAQWKQTFFPFSRPGSLCSANSCLALLAAAENLTCKAQPE